VTWASGRGWIPGELQTPEILLAPAAAALAVSAALGMVAFDLDLRRYRFGWRQVACVGAALAVVVGTLPVLGAARDGRWHMPSVGMVEALQWTRGEQEAGAFQILWVGDAASLPLGGWPLSGGLAYATSRNGPPNTLDLWPGPQTRADALIPDALDLARRGDTTRVGHLLAPMAVRYVVVTERLAPGRVAAPRTPVPASLSSALAAQIDLELVPSDPSVTVFENTAWGPGRAVVAEGASLRPSRRGADRSADRPVMSPRPSPVEFEGPVPDDATVFLSDDASAWQLSVGGTRVRAAPAFGWARAFRVAEGGAGTLRFPWSPWRFAALGLELALCIAALAFVLSARRRPA
jgi:hypothetical protein